MTHGYYESIFKTGVAEQGADVKVSVNEVNKLNESYEAITVTPEGSNIGVNISLEKFYDAVHYQRNTYSIRQTGRKRA